MGKIMHAGQAYSGGGGTTVIANPTGTPSTDLEKVSIEGVLYNIPTGGSGTVTDVKVDNVSVVDQNGVANIDTMTGAGASEAGAKGLVPAPASGDNEKFLKGDGTWGTPSGGGGSSTLAGLSDVDLDNLTNGQILKYNTTTQKWENADESGGGGSGYSETTLFTGTYQTTSGEITLNDNMNNYDQIIIYARWSQTTTNGATPFVVDREYFVSHYPYDSGATTQTSNHIVLCPYDNQYIRVKCGSANNKLFLYDAHYIAIERVAGLKYGGGGSGGASALANLSDVDVETTPPTDGQVLMYDDTNDKWVNGTVSGGTTVVANPQETATATLTKLKVGDTVYELPSGGGGSGNLFERSFVPTLEKDALTDKLKDNVIVSQVI